MGIHNKQSFTQEESFVKKSNGKAEANQGIGVGIRDYFMGLARACAIKVLMEQMEICVEEACGTAHQRGNGARGRRSGSQQTKVLLFGEHEEMRKPRMRERSGEGEIENRTYEAIKGKGLEAKELFGLMQNGVSTRSLGRLERDGSSAHYGRKAWKEGTAEALEKFRSRDLGSYEFFSMMVDGVFLSDEIAVVVAMGITTGGEKVLLDFEVGSSENLETASLLMKRIKDRGFRPATERLLVVLDGSDALEKAVKRAFEKVEIQRCLVHKERNLHSYLAYRDRGECTRLIKELRKAQGSNAGQQAYERLEEFLKARNDGALKSLQEAGESLLTVHRLECSQLLHSSLLSTNLIENAFLNYRRQTNRVTRWNTKSDQVTRWTACALVWVEVGFRKIRNYEKLPELIKALGGVIRPAVASV
jgi:transposase-like protein